MEFDAIKIDLTYFYSLTNNDKAFELKLLSGTVADVDKLVNKLKNAFTSKDSEAVKQSAHSLISLSAVVGVPMVETWCRKIEHVFSSNQFHAEYEPLLNNVFSVWSIAFPQLQEVMTAMFAET